ncbi:MAG: class I SAM-dependent methyltransferase [Bacteroidota bacterium]|nr:class I SAM-dependent methyltransferase [Bacteroidota bacterium]
MQYDPIKKVLGNVFNRNPFLRKFFFRLLDLLLLRSWHIHKEIRKWKADKGDNTTILDAGFGFGQYSYYLHTLNKKWNITGIDVKEEQVKDCNEFFNKIGAGKSVKFIEGDLTLLNKKDLYDLVVCVDVMEHIEDDVKVFENYYASLKDKGMLLISTPSDKGGSDSHGQENSFIDEHVRDGYSISDIKEKLNKAGFDKVEVKYNYGIPGKISWLISMKIPLKMLNFTKLLFIILPFYYIIAYPVSFILNIFDTNFKHKSGTGLIVNAWK